MNVIASHVSPLAADRAPLATREVIGRTLHRLSAEPKGEGAAEVRGLENGHSGRFAAQGKRVQAAMAEVQQATSAVQTADAFLGGLTEILNRLGELAARAQSRGPAPAAAAADGRNFQAAQLQLRQAIGVSIQGEDGASVSLVPVTFNGSELFAADGRTEGAENPAGLPKFRLRAGAIAALTQQDREGNFLLGAADPAAPDFIKSAQRDVADGRAALSVVNARLQLEVVTLQIESENISSIITTSAGGAGGADLTRSAKAALLERPAEALAALANLTPSGVLQVLER